VCARITFQKCGLPPKFISPRARAGIPIDLKTSATRKKSTIVFGGCKLNCLDNIGHTTYVEERRNIYRKAIYSPTKEMTNDQHPGGNFPIPSSFKMKEIGIHESRNNPRITQLVSED
jgi:hypothetical protein